MDLIDLKLALIAEINQQLQTLKALYGTGITSEKRRLLADIIEVGQMLLPNIEKITLEKLNEFLTEIQGYIRRGELVKQVRKVRFNEPLNALVNKGRKDLKF